MTDHDLQRRAARLVSQEVLCCVSGLVSTLANGWLQEDADEAPSRFRAGKAREGRKALSDLCERAFELSCPIPDYESAAQEAGWEHLPRDPDGQNVFRDTTDGQTWCAPGWEDLCRDHDIEPHDREVFEHWAITPWLADKLEAKGEKVDRDFAGLTVWARTTTGQAISIDDVIAAITTETGFASEG